MARTTVPFTATATLGEGAAAVSFSVRRFHVDGYRASFCYTVVRGGVLLAQGDDLTTTAPGNAEAALEDLIFFASAAVEGGDAGDLFPFDAIQAFDKIALDLELYELAHDAGFVESDSL